MTPGPTKISKIKSSGNLIKIETLNSGNTFGARHWTDGKMEAKMLPERSWLRVHPKTKELFWTDECDKIGEEYPWKEDSKYKDIPLAQNPDLDDLRKALDSEISSSEEKKKFILDKFWRKSNDSIRHEKGSLPEDFEEKLINYRSILNLNEPNERIIALELSRELKDFSLAKELLNFNFPEGYKYTLNIIESLIEKEDSLVREITQ